ncbi:Gamma-ECS [Intoshia linei]|uniref:Glutamate--cysteine ligase n=1 Tax=Intoshia linei TaxID=1819745 RepID=A0A177B410_9BILA|nr:Gamma-ECS [Intoshia linei]
MLLTAFPISLTRNIRQRRHKKVAINIPIYQDKFTKDPYEDVHMKPLGAIPNHIHMDASGFGMGCCCLQMTFQARCIEEARHIYDQLAAFTPIILALSSASPVYKSYLSNIDCRWNVIAASMDDRTDEELGLSPLKNDEYKIPKSRYGSITSYLTEKGRKFNDVKIVKNEEYYQNLLDNGVDDLLAQHIAHLFIRDPISCYREKLNIDNENDTDHFENIQSTNWQSLRFKLPPPNSPIGWRVEFRTPDLQFTDFENAAFITFVSLMTRVIIYNTKLNFIIPISKLDQNIQRAHTPNAVVDEKFYFNKNYDKVGAPENIVEMTINEIMNGCENFRGMINLMYVHINKGCINDKLRHILAGYMQLIQKRSNGELVTNATWIRNFITSHPEYQQDSKITHSINYDLLSTIRKISNLEIFDCKLLPCIYICDQQLVKSKNYNRDKQEEIIAKNKKCVEIAIKYKRLIYSSTEKIDKCNWEIFHDEHCECRSVVDC